MGKKAKRIEELEIELQILRSTFEADRARRIQVEETQRELLQQAQAELREWHYLGDTLQCMAGGAEETDWRALVFTARAAGLTVPIRKPATPEGMLRRPHRALRFVPSTEEASGENPNK